MASTQHDICAICLEQPKNPKSLPTCTHLFCEACLNNYVKRHETEESVSCPTCTMACPIQDINIEGPAEDEFMAVISCPTTKELCTFCSYKGLEAEAEFFCDRCEDAFLCRDCAKSHGKKPRFRGHGAKPLSDFIKLARCTRHAGRAMKFLCIGCEEPACEICADVEHDDHELVDIGGVSKKLKNYNLEQCLVNAYECASTLQRQLQDIRNMEEAVIALIQIQAARLKKRIEKRKDVLVSAVKAKAGGKQLDMDICGLVKNLEGSLECASDISKVDITNAEQVRNALSTEAALNKTRLESSKTIAAFKSRMLGMSVPRFVPKEGLISVGELEYLPSTITDPVRLELGGTYVRVPCYKIGKAVPFIRKPRFYTGTVLQNVVFVETNTLRGAKRWSLQMAGHHKPTAAVPGPIQEAIDMIVNNNGELLMLIEDQLYRYIPHVKQDGKEGSLHAIMYVHDAVSVALTKTGQYVLLQHNDDGETFISIFSADSKVIWGPIGLTLPRTLPPEDVEGLKILCPESTDLLLICDGEGEKVSVISLAVKQDSMVDGKVRKLQRYFARRTPILPPVEGFYILDICCDEGKVYVCIKKRTRRRTVQPPDTGSIKFYQATYTYDKWHYTAIPLEDPKGKPFSELKKDEILQLGAHKGTLMCLVYSPIPLAELKESKEPGMNVTWYHGKLP